MRRVHVALVLILLAAAAVAVFERRPALEDFDPHRHGDFADTWDQRIHLAYWEKWGAFEGEAAAAMVDAFNRSQDDIFVHYIQTSQVDRKALLATMGGDPPDIVGLWDANIPAMAEAGALMPLDELMQQAGLDEDHYLAPYLHMGRYEGRIHALPSAPASLALFYNRAHFRAKADELRAAGLDPERPPRTIEELDRYAEVLTEFDEQGNPKVMGFMHTDPGWYHYAWGFYFGGELVDEQTGRITAHHPANIDAYTWIKTRAERWGRQRLSRFRSGFGSFDSPQNPFVDEKVSMIMQGVWFPNFIRRHRPHMDFGVAPLPVAEGVPGPRSILEADMLAIPAGARNPEASWRFLEWVQREGLPILCRLQGKHLPLAEVPLGFREGHPNSEVELFEALARSPHSVAMPRIPGWFEYRDELVRAFEQIWNWRIPEHELAGLEGEARRARIEQLSREYVERTLRNVTRRIQAQVEQRRQRRDLRQQRTNR